MITKRIIALLFSAFLITSIVSCKKDESIDNKEDQTGNKEAIHEGNKDATRIPRGYPRVCWNCDEDHDQEHGSPQVLEVAPIFGRDLISHGPQDVPREHDEEAVGRSPKHSPEFFVIPKVNEVADQAF